MAKREIPMPFRPTRPHKNKSTGQSLDLRKPSGTSTALTWRKGKEIRRRCVGVLECSARSCSFDLQCAPELRRVDLHRQLKKSCLCGEPLRLRECGVEYSLHIFRGGGHFLNSGLHTHPRYTHSLIHRPQQPFQFTENTFRLPILLNEPYNVSDDESKVPEPDSLHNEHELDEESDQFNDTEGEQEQILEDVANDNLDWDALDEQEMRNDPEADG
ncbi:hypothetical protein B0H16DRAFT_1627793 [Mycena metata]|uniref:Uncharacterized protein n=1 Tax=Mycena metata TaxID=1033252 RepID=A0AAD7H4E8_9AGAR|nr:hypothetical protein B0H16DRAFT_1627793 [Mycena metata]